MSAVVKPDAPDAALSPLIFNTDVTTLVMTQQKGKIIITSELRKYLRDHNLNAAVTAVDKKGRSIGIMPTMAADGKLLCVVIFIKDTKYTAPKLTKESISHPPHPLPTLTHMPINVLD